MRIGFAFGGVIGAVGDLHFVRNAEELLIATHAYQSTAVLHTQVPLPDWPNAAANEANYLGPLDIGPLERA